MISLSAPVPLAVCRRHRGAARQHGQHSIRREIIVAKTTKTKKSAKKKSPAKKSPSKTTAKKSTKRKSTKKSAKKKATPASKLEELQPVTAETTEVTTENASSGNERRRDDRRKVQRRRQIDPTTCERDYSGEEIEFMRAMDDYKRASGRMFPTCSEILEVIRALGYTRPQPEAAEASTPVEDNTELESTAETASPANGELSEEGTDEQFAVAADTDIENLTNII